MNRRNKKKEDNRKKVMNSSTKRKKTKERDNKNNDYNQTWLQKAKQHNIHVLQFLVINYILLITYSISKIKIIHINILFHSVKM